MIPLGVLASRRAAAGGGLSRSYLAFYGDAADRAEYTFASAALGTASASRTIVVAVIYRNVISDVPSAVTIGGVSASIAVATGGQNGVAIVSAVVPTGSTGDIVVTFPSTSARCGVAVWEVDGLVAVVDTDAIFDNNWSVASWSTSMNTTAGGLMFGAAFSNTSSATSPTWTGVAQDAGGMIENIRYGVASDTTSGGSESVGIDWTPSGVFIRSVAFVSYEPA